MAALKSVEYLTDSQGRRRSVVLRESDYCRLQEEIEDLENALAFERARKDATGFKKWNEFVADTRRSKQA